MCEDSGGHQRVYHILSSQVGGNQIKPLVIWHSMLWKHIICLICQFQLSITHGVKFMKVPGDRWFSNWFSIWRMQFHSPDNIRWDDERVPKSREGCFQPSFTNRRHHSSKLCKKPPQRLPEDDDVIPTEHHILQKVSNSNPAILRWSSVVQGWWLESIFPWQNTTKNQLSDHQNLSTFSLLTTSELSQSEDMGDNHGQPSGAGRICFPIFGKMIWWFDEHWHGSTNRTMTPGFRLFIWFCSWKYQLLKFQVIFFGSFGNAWLCITPFVAFLWIFVEAPQARKIPA
jgi:hypothetical protein